MMLGVRRSGVSVAASTLQAAGLVRILRGHVLILDPDGLATAACDCYRIIQQIEIEFSGTEASTVRRQVRDTRLASDIKSDVDTAMAAVRRTGSRELILAKRPRFWTFLLTGRIAGSA